MKEVLVTIRVNIGQDVYEDFLTTGISKEEILNDVKLNFNSARIEMGLVEDFEVEDIKEVKE